MAEQPGDPKKFGLHPETHRTDLIGGQYRPEKNGWIRVLLGFQGAVVAHLAQVFVDMLEALRNPRQEDRHDSN
jgi:hypothetical protein